MSNQSQHNQNMGEEGRNKGGQHSPGNFKNDQEKAREASRKGSEQSHGHKERE